ncbi:hypothetical protein CONCODRAFT_14799 [Conidiobolus coronatus NRRL 28638]|uniref:Membrane-associated proteins in eicosanoid and glutathione metabolism n=1 Tax=Conidiobolus coronatus (strain ATCC 28846 / CBS 209.66 / NRRL 28638) TaxID=796925 RepID=A0A137PHK4_CONC2|nr:hypothetical protein CONCODRAFT_14799 [Conidiobolus coronatus NRRL 28638]|eukprot:KXN74462.1 hypothetical protein CONCODRAFT_14799 [Conidiobolus coronatus NRRL 28638]
MSITISKDYGFVLLSSSVIAAQCFSSSFPASKLRKTLNIPYPDTGSGRFTQKLSDEDWEKFNNAQRVHHNYVEQHSIVQVLLLTAGIFHPIYSAATGAAYIVARHIYTYGYLKYGPTGRQYGSFPIHLSLLAFLGLSIHGTTKLLEWY